MAQAPVISIIVVSYNTCEMTLECLRSVYAQTTVPFELIVVDNASNDGSAEAITAEFPNLTLMAETENHGFAKANNMAAKHCTAPYILLLNPDTLVLDHALDALYAFSQNKPEALIWGGRTYYGDMSLNRASCWQRITLWNLFCRGTGLAGVFKHTNVFNPEAYGGWGRDDIRPVDIVSGCLLLISRKSWEKLGGFDLTFVMYGEDADLCLRAQSKLGADPHTTPAANIVHYGGASEKVRADKVIRVNKAKTELIKRHLPSWQQPLAHLLFASWPLSRRLVFTLIGRPSANDWSEVWARRREWQKGFSS